jgi:hypothetical protein
MKILSDLFYFLRKIWFSVFPRVAGHKGFVAATKINLKAVAELPPAPSSWGSPRIAWRMFGNGPDPANIPEFPNGAGDCVVAGIFHAIMAVADYLGLPAGFTTPEAFAAYLALTGGKDTGLNPSTVLESWQAGTLPTAAQIFRNGGPFVTLDPTNVQQMKDAIAAFGWVGIGVNLQQAQEDQFARGQIWKFVPGSPVVGGHFVILTGFDKYNVGPYTISWAKGFRSSWGFVTNTAVEAYTGILPPELAAGKYVASVDTLKRFCAQLPAA